MSRMTALWTAGAVALLFALVIGAVLMRPVLSVNADTPGTNSQVTVSTLRQDEPVTTEGAQLWRGDDDGHEGQRDGESDHFNLFDDNHSNSHEDDD